MEPALVATSVFALFITKLVDAVRSFDKQDKWPEVLWILTPMVLGVFVAVVFNLNIFSRFGDEPVQEVIGVLLTGVGMGAIGSGWHEVLDALSGSAKRSSAAAATVKRSL